MSDSAKSQPSGTPLQSPDATESGADGVTFTPAQQALLDKLFAQRAEQGGRAAVSALLKDLGVENVDALKAVLAEATKLKKSQMTELEQARAAADEWRAKYQQERERLDALAAEYDAFRLRHLVGSTARELGFVKEDEAYLLLDLSKLERDDNGEYSAKDIEAALKALAQERPHLLARAPVAATNINAQSRGKGTTVTPEQLIERKRTQYAGTV